MSAPLNFASLSMEKNPSMPLQAGAAARKKTAAKKPEVTEAAAPAPAPVAAPKPKVEKPKVEKPKVEASPVDESEDAAAAASPVEEEKKRKEPIQRTYHTGYAMVKEVLSGDSLVLAGSASGDVKDREKNITLTGVQAPRFGRGKNSKGDEPFAWESREYLRKHVIGQQVQFTIQHTAGDDSNARHYGVVTLKGTDIAQQMIKAGLVAVKKGPAGSKVHPEREALMQLEAAAIERGLGIHRKGVNPEDHKRIIDWAPDAQALYAANKGVPLPAVVDQVRDGSTLRLELIHPQNPMIHSVITTYLSGVSCPRTPMPASVIAEQNKRKLAENPKFRPSNEKPEPFSEEAQRFTEDRLLNRDVHVVLQGVDKTGNLFGTIQFAKGNISVKLLELGYGKLVPWSAALSPDAAKLKAAEAQAKAQKLRLWANWSPEQEAASSASSGATLGEFQGKVLSIPSADSLSVETPEGKEMRVWLASVRAPRLASRGKDSKDEPFAQEAKEFLRSKLIGQKVRIVPEYVRASAADDDREARTFATVFQNKINMNEALIATGFAEAVQHRMDEERSQFYDAYLAAENKAKETSKGKWDPKEHIVTRVTDLTDRIRPRAPKKAAPKPAAADAAEGEEEKTPAPVANAPLTKAELEVASKNKALSAKALQYYNMLHGKRDVAAVVEFVFSSTRFKILIPKEHVLVSFSLAGVRKPQQAGFESANKDDAFATEVLTYVRSRLNQHSVKIEVENKDKADNFLGSLFHNRTNLAVDLLQRGYVEIFGFSAAKSPYAKDLYAAERKAKEAKVGCWVNWVEPTPEEKAAAAAAGNAFDDAGEDQDDGKGPVERVAKITEIVDCSDFFVQFVGDKNAEAVEKALAAVAALPESDEPFNIPESAKGRPFLAAGQFSDDSWHRVRIDGQDGNGDFNVCFIDFGNFDTLLGDRLRLLPAEASKIPPLAVHCALAGLIPPRAAEYQEGSALAFSEMAFGIDLKCVVEFSDRFGRKQVTLSHESHPISVNRQLLRDGWARVQSKPDNRIRRLVAELEEEEKYAKDHHYNLFEYGDVEEEDAETAAIKGPDPKARAPRGKPAQK